MQLAAVSHAPVDLTGKVVGRLADLTDMPQESTTLVALAPIGPAGGWKTAEEARAAVLELTAEEGPQNPAAAVFKRNGHYEAWTLGSTLHGWDPSTATPLEAYWQDGDVAYCRSGAGASLQFFAENGAVLEPRPYDEVKHYFRLDD